MARHRRSKRGGVYKPEEPEVPAEVPKEEPEVPAEVPAPAPAPAPPTTKEDTPIGGTRRKRKMRGRGKTVSLHGSRRRRRISRKH